MKRGKVTLLFAITYMAFYLCRYNYATALPFLKESLDIPAVMVGAIATALTVGYAIGQFVNGVLVDRYGPRLLMTVGGVGVLIANLFMGGSTFYTMLILGWLMNGYFQSMGYPSSLRLISNWWPKEERGKQVGISEAAQSLASIGILPFSGWLAQTFDWRLVFIVPGLMMGVATLWYWRNARDWPSELQNTAAAIPSTLWTSGYLEDAVIRYKTALGNWRLVAANLSYGLCQYARYAMITWIPSFLFEASGDTIFTAAIKGTAFQVGGVLGSFGVGWLSDQPLLRNRRWAVIAIAMITSAIAAGAIGFAPGAWVMVALFVAGVGIESIEVAYFLIPSDFLGDDLTGTGVGVMNATGKAVASLQGVTLGAIIDAFSYSAAFATAGVFSLLAAVLVLPLRSAKWKN